MNVEKARRDGAEQLNRAGVESPRLDADLLLCKALGWERSTLLAHPERILTSEEEAAFRQLLARRTQREPLGYILGVKEFYGLNFFVTPNVLIPRPETELLVDISLDFLRRQNHPALMADVGAGSGAIAVSVAVSLGLTVGLVYSSSLHEISHRIVALDSSLDALHVAKRNASFHKARINLVAADLIAPIAGPIQLIAANLPYIPTRQIPLLQPEIRLYEPKSALDGGEDGLDHYRRLLAQARSRIDTENGLIAMEMGADQGEKLASLARDSFPNAEIAIHRDLAGLDRVVTVRFEGI